MSEKKILCRACGGDGKQYGPPEGTIVSECGDCRGSGRADGPRVGDRTVVNGMPHRIVDVTQIWSRYEPKSGKTTMVVGHCISTRAYDTLER